MTRTSWAFVGHSHWPYHSKGRKTYQVRFVCVQFVCMWTDVGWLLSEYSIFDLCSVCSLSPRRAWIQSWFDIPRSCPRPDGSFCHWPYANQTLKRFLLNPLVKQWQINNTISEITISIKVVNILNLTSFFCLALPVRLKMFQFNCSLYKCLVLHHITAMILLLYFL